MVAQLRCPQARLWTPVGRRARAVIIACSAVLLAGCMSSHSGSLLGRSDAANPAIALQRAHMAQMQPPHVVELEDDGLPVQTAPFRTRQQRPDDPSEPFSPNYGSPPPQKPSKDRQAWAPMVDETPNTHVAGWQRIDPVDAEIVVSRALSEHERRFP